MSSAPSPPCRMSQTRRSLYRGVTVNVLCGWDKLPGHSHVTGSVSNRPDVTSRPRHRKQVGYLVLSGRLTLNSSQSVSKPAEDLSKYTGLFLTPPEPIKTNTKNDFA